jgi:hypothetical protein
MNTETLTELNYTLGRTAFEPGKSLSEQLREERLKIAKEMEPYKDSRTRLDMMKPDIAKRSGYFLERSNWLEFKKPLDMLPELEIEVMRLLDLPYPTIKMKVRYQEVVDAKKVFIFFALCYLNLTSFQVADYLNMNRSTLSHHVHDIIDVVNTYAKFQEIFKELDTFLYQRADRVGVKKHKSPNYRIKGEVK